MLDVGFDIGLQNIRQNSRICFSREPVTEAFFGKSENTVKLKIYVIGQELNVQEAL